MKDKLLIYSGGMDSTVLLHEKKNDIAMAVSFHYGSKHAGSELRMAERNCRLLKIEHKIVDLREMSQHLKSNLLESGGEIPEGHYAESNMKSTVVPFRNGIMLSIAIGIAESHNLASVMIANHVGDHAVYPDCRSEFIESMAKASYTGTYNGGAVESPYGDISKREIALIGNGIQYFNFGNTWSCYKGGEKHCGKCGTCVERIEALDGFDPTEYEDTSFAMEVLKRS
jgi:7-cyano-7-deazaguanine synthase